MWGRGGRGGAAPTAEESHQLKPKKTLQDFLPEEEWRNWLNGGYFEFKGSEGHRYQLDNRGSHNIHVLSSGVHIFRTAQTHYFGYEGTHRVYERPTPCDNPDDPAWYQISDHVRPRKCHVPSIKGLSQHVHWDDVVWRKTLWPGHRICAMPYCGRSISLETRNLLQMRSLQIDESQILGVANG